MLACFDIDGTLDADPTLFLSIMQAFRAAGHRVAVLTGCSSEAVTAEDVTDKETYLAQLGLGAAYDQLAVFSDPPHKAKGEWLLEHNADILFDNSKQNAREAPVLTLVPWKTRTD